jgi:hypothetical protein
MRKIENYAQDQRPKPQRSNRPGEWARGARGVKQALVPPSFTTPTFKPCRDPSRIFSQAM